MKIGIELGWRAVRVITVGTQNEILSVNDVGQPSVVSTPPIVALSKGGGGALVGQSAIDLVQDETQAALIKIGHALAGLGGGGYSPELLAILLEKIGRDIEGFGSSRADVRFIVSEDIVPVGVAGKCARDQLAQAAYWAGFVKPTLSYRVDAAVREGLDAYTAAEIKTKTTRTQPVVRTIVIDAGPLSLSAYAVVATTPSVAPWAGQPGINTDLLAFDMFRHFALTVEAQTGANFSAPVMNSIWELVRDPQSPAFQLVFDRGGQRHLFNVGGCRRELAKAVRQSLPGLLAGFAALSDDSFIFIGGQYATIPEVNETIREICKQTLAKPRSANAPIPLYFGDVPAHGVAGAVRFDDLPFVSLVSPVQPALPPLSDLQQKLPAHLQRAPESLHDLQTKPVNDGQWPDLKQKQQENGNVLKATSTGLLDGVISHVEVDTGRGVDVAGKQAGALWAQKIDTLLRLLLTAPTVGLKERYEQYFKLAEIDHTALRDRPRRASWWRRLFDPQARDSVLADLRSSWSRMARRQVAEVSTELRKNYLDPVLARLTADLVSLAAARGRTFDAQAAGANIILGFDGATRFADSNDITPTGDFKDYVEDQRSAAVGLATPLTLFNGRSSSRAKRPVGITMSNRVILTAAALAHTHLSREPRSHTLGYTPEGGRTILATSSRAVGRWQFMPWFRWLMGGHVGVLQMAGIVVLFGGVAALSGAWSLRALQPTLLHASIDRGTLVCPEMAVDARADVTCNALTQASFGTNTWFHDGCYLNVMRLVLPAQNLTYGVQSIDWRWPAPPSEASLVCQAAHGFDMASVLADTKYLDRVTAGLRLPITPEYKVTAGQKSDATFSYRVVGLNVPADPNAGNTVGPVNLVDVAWISAAPGREGIALGGPTLEEPTPKEVPLGTSFASGDRPTWPFSFIVADNVASNRWSAVVNSGLCVDIGARLNIVAIGSGEDPAKLLGSIVSDAPGKDLAFLRFALDGAENSASIDDSLLEDKLFLPRVVPATPIQTEPPGNRGELLTAYPNLEDSLLQKEAPLGFGRTRLIGACPPR
ncbi:MAG: hypothetical protein E5X49_17215 [Mesorhizobium sp.]|uniref:hypothetical protein n=1 Tax=Mesorhizobium sp. TaxID=1871066 RepID=UPI00120D8DA6|nr:hypothetical protein [Mesorhizobium sp.]TIQ41874.1 MAG: hypothetical protein E5X49_17215 [Mesorhizobium sp.]